MIFLTDSIDHLSGPILGRVADDTGNCVATETNNRSINILVIGERGTGKSEDYAANAVLQAVKQSRNIICSDDNICEFAAHEEMLSHNFIFDDFQNIGYIPQLTDILYDIRRNPYNNQKTQISIIVEKTADLQAAYGVELNRLLASIDVTVGFHYNNNPSMLMSWLKKSSAAKECNVSVYDMDSQRELNLIGLSYLDHPMIK